MKARTVNKLNSINPAELRRPGKMTMYSATYSPDDNKLRLYATSRLPDELYARVRAAGFIYAPKQELFVAPMWTPGREDLLVELCGQIDDEDTSLCERAEDRAERFEGYSEKRAEDAERAREAVAAIADNIPLGQPIIMVGHHSEAHARRDAQKIENGMRRAVKMWETSNYWISRAKGAIRHAKYKERPDVRARRIKKIEADKRKQERTRDNAQAFLKVWERIHEPDSLKKKDGTPSTIEERALYIANRDSSGPHVWSALHDGKMTGLEAQQKSITHHRERLSWAQRWITHYENRLAYERAMLEDQGGTAADRSGPEVGGACKCWASPRGGWSYIQKVNKVSVTLLDNWGNGGGNFTRTIPFDKLSALMTAAEVQAKRNAGLLYEMDDKTGFILKDELPKAAPPKPAPDPTVFAQMKESLRAGVQAVSAPQLFPTPRELAERLIEEAQIEPGMRVLEPSAGTGALLGAMGGRMFAHNPDAGAVVAVEHSQRLADRLTTEFPLTEVHCADFLQCNGALGTFDRIVMNPPFADNQDIAHVEHALTMLKPGGRLVAIMSNGITFRQDRKTQAFRELLETRGGSIEPLPDDAFEASGTSVRTVLVTIDC